MFCICMFSQMKSAWISRATINAHTLLSNYILHVKELMLFSIALWFLILTLQWWTLQWASDYTPRRHVKTSTSWVLDNQRMKICRNQKANFKQWWQVPQQHPEAQYAQTCWNDSWKIIGQFLLMDGKQFMVPTNPSPYPTIVNLDMVIRAHNVAEHKKLIEFETFLGMT